MSTEPKLLEGELPLPEHPTVTDSRNNSEKMSDSRNAEWPTEYPPGSYGEAYALGYMKANPSVCHHCREKFAVGQMRYPIRTEVEEYGWALASVCMDCFKCASDEETSNQKRYQCECRGCGEPMLTPRYRPFHFLVCSNRCYQRDYRKRRRNTGSVISWKGQYRQQPQCAVCKKHINKQSRTDVVYCSPACRQWAYRRRHGQD